MSTTAEGPDRSPARWTHMAERGSMLGIRWMVWVHRRLGRRVTGVLLYLIVAYFWLFAGETRRASRLYFERLALHSPQSVPPRPLLGHTFHHLYTFAVMIVDRLCFWTGNYEDFDVTIHGREAMEPLIEARRGGFLVGAHLGSFDVLRVIARDADIRVNVVMFTANAQRINQVLTELDPGSALRIIELDPTSIRASFEIRSCIERGEFVAVLGDRVGLGGRNRIAHADFLGVPAPFPEGPFLIPMLLRLPVVLCLALKRGPRRYEIFLEPLAEAAKVPAARREEVVRERIAAFAARLEHYVQLEPYQWFNLYDFWAGEVGP